MEITVAGSARAHRAPERATVTLVVEHEGADLADCVRRTTERTQSVAAAVRAARGLEQVVVEPLTTRTWRPYTEGEPAPVRYAASSRVVATFTDVVALSAVVGEQGAVEGVQVEGVVWSLSDDERRRVEAQVLAEAVAAARERAQTVATAAGVGPVRLLEVADPGLLSRGSTGGERSTMRAMSAMSGEGGGIDVAPRDLVVEATVHARFDAGAADGARVLPA